MGLLDSLSSAVQSQAVSDVAKAAASSWYTPVVELAGDFSTWMEENPIAAQAIGGAAVAGLNYANQKDQQQYDERMYHRKREDTLTQASSGSGSGNYGEYSKNLVGGTGLLTNGLLAKKRS